MTNVEADRWLRKTEPEIAQCSTHAFARWERAIKMLAAFGDHTNATQKPWELLFSQQMP